MILYNFILALIISIIIFGIYVELNPKMTNIWYRINSEGIKTIQLDNLLYLMSGPLRYIFYWYPNYLDINYFIYLIITFIIIQEINKKNTN
jgi:hypothetical protein